MDLAGKKVIVTGADGFIGSHLVEALVRRGSKVKALAYYNSFNHWGWLEDVEDRDSIDIVTGDIRDAHFCKSLLRDAEIVFHLAALIAIPYSYVAPDSYVDTNVRGTLNICQASLECKCQRLVVTSTSEVYGTARYVPINEEHPLQPQSPYSASKIGADAMAMSFYNSYGLPVVLARPFNTYGPRQSARAVIPTIIIQMAAGMNEIRLGDVSPTRDFSYVADTCSGLVSLAECDEAIGQTVNIGSNYEISIAEVYEIIRNLMNINVRFVMDDKRIRPGKSEVLRLWCDNKKIKALTGFAPSHDIRKGLEKTIPWYLDPNNLKKFKSGIYNV